MKSLGVFFSRQPRVVLFVEGFFLVLLMGYFDYLLGPEISFSIFYLIPILLVTWFSGRADGLFLAVFGAIVWYSSDFLAGAQYSSPYIPVWNSLVRLSFFVVSSLLLYVVRNLYTRQEEIVDERTRDLVAEIAERKKAQERLLLLANAVESSADLICITNLDDRFIFANSAFLKTYGYSESEILGAHTSVLRPMNYNPELVREISSGTRQGGWSGELLNVKKDGTVFPVFLSTSQIKDAQGNVFGLVGVARYISDLKHAGDALYEADARFRQLFTEKGQEESVSADMLPTIMMHDLARKIDEVVNKIREGMKQTLRFSSLASHEIRTPLTVIRHQLEGALQMKASAVRRRKIVVGVYDEILRLGHIVDDLLSLGTMQAGTFKLHLQRVNFGKFLKDFADEAVLLSRSKKVNIVLKIGKGAYIDADVIRLRQLMFNLLDNSLKHTPPRGRIRLTSASRNGSVKVDFSDTGSGIPPARLAHIFDPFYKGETADDSHGTGLGLAMVKLIVEAHNGRISVKSSRGKGTTFSIKLPLSRKDIAPGTDAVL